MAEKTVIQRSWDNDEQLAELAKARRENDILRGVVISVGTKEVRVQDDGQSVTKGIDVAVLAMENGTVGYCPAPEFSEREYRSLNGFTGSMQEFIIDNIDLDTGIVSVSVRKADDIKKKRFFELLQTEQAADTLKNHVFEGIVSGYNATNNHIFVRIEGTDAFMNRNDWDWGRVRNPEDIIERGETIPFKVSRFDAERSLIQVSRRAAIPDPFQKLETLKEMDSVAGKITGVDPIHGIFVMLDIGLEVKGIKPSYLEEPTIGDIVSCRIRTIDRKNRHAKVVLINYPRGKKKKKDVGAFLFD